MKSTFSMGHASLQCIPLLQLAEIGCHFIRIVQKIVFTNVNVVQRQFNLC